MAKRQPALCLQCAWKGQRTLASAANPCPKCGSMQVAVAGVGMAIPYDPSQIARILDADPALHWRVLRALGSRILIGPWTPIGADYWERATFDGTRSAWIWLELGAFNWETSESKGAAASLQLAMAAADRTLEDRAIDANWRLVNPVR